MTNLSYGPFISCKQAKAQGLSYYVSKKPCKHGHIAARHVTGRTCEQCKMQWYEGNKEQVNAQSKAWAAANPEKVKEVKTRSALKNRDAQNFRRKQHKAEFEKKHGLTRHQLYYSNPEARANRCETRRSWKKQKWTNDSQYRLKSVLSHRVRLALKSQGACKKTSAQDLLGCSADHAKQHIQSLFCSGMNWENMGQWHIDHIRPCASFDLTDPEQQKQCFHFSNLQPLWAADNLAKSDTWEPMAA